MFKNLIRGLNSQFTCFKPQPIQLTLLKNSFRDQM